MALVEGAPSIVLEGDTARGLALIPEGQLLLMKAQAIAARADVPVMSLGRPVGDDAYIYVLKAGSVNIINISVGSKTHTPVREEEPEIPTEDLEYRLYPDFLSGVVLNGIIDTKTVTNPDGSESTFNVLRSFAATPTCTRITGVPHGPGPVRRLTVRPNDDFGEWNNPAPNSPFVFSQYHLPRTSQWSGSMKKVVQVVMGLGRITKAKLLNSNFAKAKETAYISGVLGTGVQVLYDYKFMRTHGITRAEDGRLWLIEISAARGVLAMPLPIFPDSEKAGFLIRAQNRNDGAMITVLEELGCLPTGESFPSTAVLNKKIASGDILQLMTQEDIAPFYELSGFSSSCGWAFSSKGNEAHNVGYIYPEGEVLQKAMWYQINIKIGVINDHRRPGMNDPLAVGTAVLVKQSEGFLYSPPVLNSFIPVKYHEPLIDGLLSHSAKPMGPTPVPRCDTVVFVAFMNDELKVCRYFKPGAAETINESTDDRSPGECLYEGSWTWTSTTGSTAPSEMPWTNDIDPRSILEEHFSTSTLTSNSQGFDPGVVADFIAAPEQAHITRKKVYKQTTITETRGGESRSACFVVPGYSREAYYYFEGHAYDGGRSGSTTVAYSYVGDPNTGYSWRKFPRINPPEYPSGFGCRTDNCGTSHTDRRIICLTYEPGACAEYADSGPWLSQCQVVDHLGTPPIRHGYSTAWNKGTDFAGTWNFVSDGLFGMVSGPTTSVQHDKAMQPSPDPQTGLVQFIYAEHSAIGEDCVIYTQGFSGALVVTGYAPVALTGMPTFIGVNQP